MLWKLPEELSEANFQTRRRCVASSTAYDHDKQMLSQFSSCTLRIANAPLRMLLMPRKPPALLCAFKKPSLISSGDGSRHETTRDRQFKSTRVTFAVTLHEALWREFAGHPNWLCDTRWNSPICHILRSMAWLSTVTVHAVSMV